MEFSLKILHVYIYCYFFYETNPHFEDRLCMCLIRSESERLQMTASG